MVLPGAKVKALCSYCKEIVSAEWQGIEEGISCPLCGSIVEVRPLSPFEECITQLVESALNRIEALEE